MKTILLPSVFFLFCHIYADGQIAYYDAVRLSEYVKTTTTPHTFKSDAASLNEICGILSKYYPNIDATNWDDILSTLIDTTEADYNPILAPYLNVSPGVGTAELSSRSLLASVGNLNVTNFADGLARFLVARAKEELNVAFFRQFQNYLMNYPEVKVIFPATHDIIIDIYSYQYSAFLPALRSAFHKDMNSFSSNLMELRDLTIKDCPEGRAGCKERIEKLNTFLNQNTIGRTFVGALIVSDNLLKGANAVEILDAIENDKICMDYADNFSNSIRFSNLISKSLRSTEQGELWVKKTELNKLIGNEDAVKIYLGLLFATHKMQIIPIVFTGPAQEVYRLDQLLVLANDDAEYFSAFRNTLRNLGFSAAETSLHAKNILKLDRTESESSILIYADYVSSLSSFLKQAVSFFNEVNPKIKKDVHLFTAILDDAVEACYDIKAKNYTSLVLHTSQILDTLLKDNYPFRDDYIKYGTFMANIIEADNSDEIKAAIEAAVLPVGSSSIKRETYSNISLNAFIGPMAGIEYLPGLDQDQWALVVGITAPVGLSFNWGNYGNGRRGDPPKLKERANGNEIGGKSFSLYMPLIDIGSLATFRISDDDSNVAADIKLENIISPGLYFYWGLGKVPISIGAGGQIGPQLREINDTDINIDKNFYVRFGLNVVVDIPLFNFYTKN